MDNVSRNGFAFSMTSIHTVNMATSEAAWTVCKAIIAAASLTLQHRDSAVTVVCSSTKLDIECNHVVFSDESQFCMQHHDGHIFHG